jgi:hypothetical protein
MEKNTNTIHQQKSKFGESLVVLSSFLALFIALCFAIGYSYLLGYFSGAGMLLGNKESEELTTYLGFATFLELFLEFLISIKEQFFNWSTFLILLAAPILGGLLAAVAKVFNALDFVESALTAFESFWFKVFKIMLGVIATFTLFIYPNSKGTSNAKNAIHEFLKDGCSSKDNGWNRCHQIYQNDKLLHEGYLVTKSGDQLVMFKKEAKRLEYLTLPKGAILTREFEPEEN